VPSSAFYDAPKAKTGWVRPASFEEIQEKYAEHLKLEKRDGIVFAQMHTQGGPALMSLPWKHALGVFFRDIGQDRTNEVLIVTGTGENFLGEPDIGDFEAFDVGRDSFDHYYLDTLELSEGYLYNVNFPTIAAFNGRGMHTEWALMSDFVICDENAAFGDGHFPMGYVAGDGQALSFMKRMGQTRGVRHAYTAEVIGAEAALSTGLVQEVVPADRLIGRAWELAEYVMSQPRSVRRLQHLCMVRPWKEFFHQHYGYHLAHEMFGICLDTNNLDKAIESHPNMRMPNGKAGESTFRPAS